MTGLYVLTLLASFFTVLSLALVFFENEFRSRKNISLHRRLFKFAALVAIAFILASIAEVSLQGNKATPNSQIAKQ